MSDDKMRIEFIEDDAHEQNPDTEKIVRDLSDLGEEADRQEQILYDSDLDALNSDLRSIDRGASSSSNVSRKPAESVSSQGYNPNVGSQNRGSNTGSSLPKRDGINKPGGVDNNVGGGSSQPSDRRETAPDIGKDYGESQASAHDNTGYNPYAQNDAVTYANGDNQVDKKAPEDANQQDAAKANQQDKKQGDGLDKKDDLDGSDKKPHDGTSSDKKSKPADQADADNANKKPGQAPSQNSNDNTGNGYGALKKNKPQNQTSDSTANARKALDHYNRTNNRNSGPSLPNLLSGAGGKSVLGGFSGLGARLKKGVKNIFNKSRNEVSDSDKGGDEHNNSFMGDLFNNIMSSLMSSPYFWIVVAIILLFVIIMFMILGAGEGGSGRGRKSCNYSLNGVTSTGTVELEDVQVELINCDGTADDYQIIETVDFEKYILGVALAEAGVGQPDEALKAQMIAVRNFSLTRNQGMCPGNPDNCFYGYNATTNKIRLRACTNDQVYFDYEKDTHYQLREGRPTLYGPEVTEGTVWKRALSEEQQTYYENLANEIMGEVLLDENGNVLKLGYQADETTKFIDMANEGHTYVEILEEVYGSSSYSSATCSYNGSIDYFDYELSSEGDEILHERLDEFLDKQGTSLEEFNELIADNVEDAGYGTRAGVVAAAVTLIAELGNNYDVKIPYYWGGGHFDGVVVGALGYWGGTSTGSVKCLQHANGQTYSYCGFDCSGFVPWAIKNGGFKKGVDLASNFINMNGARRVNLTNSPVMQPGDLLESDGHIILIVAIDEEAGQYICAEAMGNAYGVLFTRRAYNLSGYYGVDLEDYYNNPANVREQTQ